MCALVGVGQTVGSAVAVAIPVGGGRILVRLLLRAGVGGGGGVVVAIMIFLAAELEGFCDNEQSNKGLVSAGTTGGTGRVSGYSLILGFWKCSGRGSAGGNVRTYGTSTAGGTTGSR